MQNLTRKVVHTYRASLVKACCNHIPHQASRVEAPTPSQPQPQDNSLWKTYGNPCLDMFHYLFPWINSFPGDPPRAYDNCDYHLKRLLPHAWSHSPLTTLKIVRNLFVSGPNGTPGCDAIYWIHHNHPKTLAANLIPLLLPGGGAHQSLTIILYRILDLKHVPGPWEQQQHVKEINKAIKAGTAKGIPEPLRILSNRIVSMYEKDPNFRFLHDEVSHIFAESLKFDIKNFLEKVHDYDCDKDQPLELTTAAEYCEGSPFLLEKVARRVFPHMRDVEAAEELLRNEVLAPLKKVLCPELSDSGCSLMINIYGYSHEHNESDPIRKQCRPVHDKYFKDISESPEKMVPNALVPHELVEYVIGKKNSNVSRHVVELQWKAMIEDLKKRQLRVLSSSLAVIKAYGERSLSELTYSMTILISELNEEEAWKGKAISMTPNPLLLSIQGHDLKSKCEFLQDPAKMLVPTLSDSEYYFDCKKVFDFILQQAVSGGLKPEQMINKVFVFSVGDEFERLSGWDAAGSDWDVQDYDEMRGKYREHGYDMPQIVFWRNDDHLDMPFTDSPDERGITAISGFSRANCQNPLGGVKFIKMFLENDGHMSPQHVMEAILTDEDYSFHSTVDYQMEKLNDRFKENVMELLTLSSALNPINGFRALNIDDICFHAN